MKSSQFACVSGKQSWNNGHVIQLFLHLCKSCLFHSYLLLIKAWNFRRTQKRRYRGALEALKLAVEVRFFQSNVVYTKMLDPQNRFLILM